MKSISHKLKETASHAIVYGISASIQSLVGFLLLPLLARYLTTKEYGIYSLILLIGTLAGSFFYFGASSALSRFYFENNSDEQRSRVVLSTLMITLIGAFIQICLGYLFSSQLSFFITGSDNYSQQVFLIIVANALTFIANFIFLILRLEKRSVIFVIMNVVINVVNLGLVYVCLAVYRMTIDAPIYGVLVSSFLAIIFTSYYLIPYFKYGMVLFNIKEYLFFGFPTILTGFSYYILDSVDRFLIKEYCSLSDLGIYSMGYRIGMTIHVFFILPFGMIWSTIRMQYAEDQNNREFVSKVISYYSVIGTFLVVSISIFAKEIISLFIVENSYVDAYRVVPWVMLAHLIYGYVNIIDFGIYMHKKIIYYVYIFLLGAGFNVLLNYFFLPKFGYTVAAVNTLITYAVIICIVYFLSNRLYRININWSKITPLIMSFIVIIIGVKSIEDFVKVSSYVLILKSSLILFFLAYIRFFWVSDSEIEQLKMLFKFKGYPRV